MANNMDDMNRQMVEIAKQCINVIKHVSPDEADYMESFLDVGEPDLAVVRALDIACTNPGILKQIPESVKELTKNPDYPEIQRFVDIFE